MGGGKAKEVNKMRTKNGILLIGIALLVSCAFVGTASATDIYVPDNYEKIQWAVDNATEGATIIVRDGIYTENVDVNIAHLTIRSQNGSASVTVEASDPNDYVFNVTADYVDISGFTVTGANGYEKAGIYLQESTSPTISNSTVENNTIGISISGSSSLLKIRNCVISNNKGNGISSGGSSLEISFTDIVYNDGNGLYLSLIHISEPTRPY